MGIAFMTANYVAKEIDYSGKHLLQEWGNCHEITRNSFHGSVFKEKFDRLIGDIHELGFREIELWNAHFDPLIIKDWQFDAAKEVLAKYNMQVIGLYTNELRDPSTVIENVHTIFQAAKQLGANKIIQSGEPAKAYKIVELCDQYDIFFGIENHPEKDPEELLKMIRPSANRMGACVDTGWFATQDCNPVEAVEAIGEHLLHIHFKDILATGAHDTCALGDGIVDFTALLKVLKDIKYEGTISIEHEPIDFDPTADIEKSLKRLESWLDIEMITLQ